MKERGETIEITYDPKMLIEYAERKGFITSRDLEKDFGYNKVAAGWIISDLCRLSFITSRKDDYEPIEEDMVVVRAYRLTELGRKAKEYAKPRRVVLTGFPVFSRISIELINDLLEGARARGLGLEELEEMLKSNSPELKGMMDKIRMAVLSNCSPEELRRFAKELREFSGGMEK